MLDRPQIISPEDHPQDCVVFVQRAETVSKFLLEADQLLLNGEHRIICWRPPYGEDIEKRLREEDSRGTFRLDGSGIHDWFRSEFNAHIDRGRGQPQESLILNGFSCRLSQTLRGDTGTPFFYIPQGHPQRTEFYNHLAINPDADEKTLKKYGLKDVIRGPFSLEAGNVGLILSELYNSQATLHGFPVETGDFNSRKTRIAQVEPYGLRR